MRTLKTIYLAIWFRVHPFTGDEHGRGLYMTWECAWELAREFYQPARLH